MIKKFKDLPTSKKLIYFLFINSTVIELFVLIITFISILQVESTLVSPDFSPLNTLVTAFCAEVASFAIYCLKSLKENTKGGIVFETAIKNNKEEDSSDIEYEEEAMG